MGTPDEESEWDSEIIPGEFATFYWKQQIRIWVWWPMTPPSVNF